MTKYSYFLFVFLVLFSCTQENEIYDTELIADYVPLQKGKSITYRLDSTVFTRSGTVMETHKYQVRHTITGETMDNTGHKAYIVQRFINNETATGSWSNNGNYLITPYDNKIEVMDNNLRVVALQAPLKKGFTWKGNSYLPVSPYIQLYEYNLIGYDLNKWEFSLTGFGNETIEGNQYENLWTVVQHSDSLNMPPSANSELGTKEVSSEKYAKGIGMVYKNYQLYEYQKLKGVLTYNGFGIKMWMIAHQ